MLFLWILISLFELNNADFQPQPRHLKDSARQIHLRHSTIHVTDELISQSAGALGLLDVDADQQRQWLVHVKTPITSAAKMTINKYIQPYSLSTTYIPHNTFMLVAPQHIASKTKHAPGVLHVTEYKSEYKFDRNQIQRLIARTQKLRIYLSNDPSRAFDGVVKFTQILYQELLEIEDVVVKPINEMTFSVEFPDGLENVMSVVIFISEYHDVHWIDVAPKIELLNKYTHAIVQARSENHTDTEIWDRGLRGDGQIVGISDTGIDSDMCFFHDPNHKTPFGKVNRLHRKIISYMRAEGVKDYEDEYGGHGTHTSCTLAGNAIYSKDKDTEQLMSEYNGMAPNAKLAFFDLGKADELFVPEDLYEDLYKPAYQVGARIHSDSWGDTDIGYDSLALETDKFVWENNDFLPVFAAGNEGTQGLFSISSPGVGKNVLSVGASTNSAQSFFDGGYNVGIRIDEPEAAAADLRVSTASFGPEFVRLDVLESTEIVWSAPDDLACSGIGNSDEVKGKIVVIRRGECTFYDKAEAAEAAGAVMLIVVNTDETYIEMGSEVDQEPDSISIATVMVNSIDGMILELYDAEIRITAPVDFEVPQQQMGFLTDFSSRGPTADGRRKPDVVVPGEFITSALSDGDLKTFNCDGYDSLTAMQGTSMACPLAAGSVALVRQYYTDGYYPSGKANSGDEMKRPTAALLKATMINSGSAINGTVKDLSNIHTLADLADPDLIVDQDVLPPPSLYQGFGQATLKNVLQFTDSEFQLFVVDEVAIETNDFHTYCFSINSFDLPFKVTLVWTDKEGTLASSLVLVNDLDLQVSHVESKQVYLGNNVHWVDTAQVLRHTYDELNNVEQVWLTDSLRPTDNEAEEMSAPGLYMVTVYGSHVPIDTQGYSLVVTGDFSMDSDDLDDQSTCDAYGEISADICPQDCSGNGICSGGHCECNSGFTGSDCSQEPYLIFMGGENLIGQIQPDGWEYYSLTVFAANYSNSNVVKLYIERTSDVGDPDIYVSLKGFPSLSDYDFQNTDCDSCENGKTKHIIDINYASLTAASEDGEIDEILVGVYGYCCHDSEFTIRASHGAPEGSGNGIPVWAIVIIIVFGLLALGLVFYIVWRYRRQASARAHASFITIANQGGSGGPQDVEVQYPQQSSPYYASPERPVPPSGLQKGAPQPQPQLQPQGTTALMPSYKQQRYQQTTSANIIPSSSSRGQPQDPLPDPHIKEETSLMAKSEAQSQNRLPSMELNDIDSPEVLQQKAQAAEAENTSPSSHRESDTSPLIEA